MPLPTVEQLRELLDYNPETGEIKNRISRRKARAGMLAGYTNQEGYVQIVVCGMPILGHRAAWAIHYGAHPALRIDHINGVRSDNRLCNLRQVTNAENMQNVRSAYKSNKTGLLGVSKRRAKYRAQISLDGRVKTIGTFDTAESAHAAYIKAKRELHDFGTI